jgi:hypothetical protein
MLQGARIISAWHTVIVRQWFVREFVRERVIIRSSVARTRAHAQRLSGAFSTISPLTRLFFLPLPLPFPSSHPLLSFFSAFFPLSLSLCRSPSPPQTLFSPHIIPRFPPHH